MSLANDPNSMFNQLLAGATDDQGQNKTANTNSTSPFAAGFFAKLASNDADAVAELEGYVQDRMAEGLTEDEVAAEIGAFEEADAENGTSGAGGDDDGDGADKLAELEAIELAITHELAENDTAKALGLDREKLASFMDEEAKGEAYFAARKHVAEIVEKIANEIIPSDEEVLASVNFLRSQGVDVSSIEAQVTEMQKQAAAAEKETTAQKIARETAAAEANMLEALATLQGAGFDIEKTAADAEGKKKMSGKAKAALGLGAAAAGTGLALSGAGRYAGGNLTPASGMRGLRAASALAKEHGATRTPTAMARGLRVIRAAAGK